MCRSDIYLRKDDRFDSHRSPLASIRRHPIPQERNQRRRWLVVDGITSQFID